MKTLTMVMRCGCKGDSIYKMTHTLIADDYSIVRLNGDAILEGIKSKKFVVTNMGITEKGLVVNNGAADKYTLIDAMTNAVKGKASPVVINRAETNGKLLGYVIFNTDGVLQEINVQQALIIHGVTPFANGKIRHTKDGDIIQSIEGNCPVRVIEVSKAPAGDINVDLIFLGSAIGTGTAKVKYAGIILDCENAAILSKLHGKLMGENKKLVDKVFDLSQDKKTFESLAVKRTGTAGFYGVFPTAVVFELIKKAGNKVSIAFEDLMVSCIDYKEDGTESMVKLSKSNGLKPSGKKAGTAQSEKALKEYVEEVLNAFKSVKVEADK